MKDLLQKCRNAFAGYANDFGHRNFTDRYGDEDKCRTLVKALDDAMKVPLAEATLKHGFKLGWGCALDAIGSGTTDIPWEFYFEQKLEQFGPPPERVSQKEIDALIVKYCNGSNFAMLRTCIDEVLAIDRGRR